MEQTVAQRSLAALADRKHRADTGSINCIKLPFARFRRYWPGLEKERYIIVTANQKVGKSKVSDYLFVYDPFFYQLMHPDKLKIKILYFTLEMSKEEKMYEFYCHLLYMLDDIRIDPLRLKSTDVENPCPQEVLDLLDTERYQKYITNFEKSVVFIDDVRNPTGINKYCWAYAEDPVNGRLHTKEVVNVNKLTGASEVRNIPDYYEATDDDEVRIIILDNFANLTSEKGMNKMETIDKMSKYFITLRDILKYSIIGIQHQALCCTIIILLVSL